MDAYSKAFGAHLRRLRAQRGLSQEEVAHRAGLHVTYLSGIERGLRNPTLRNIRKLALALDVPVKELFTFEE
ncbi:MAG: helix-turn-helix transcriptional regulator [Chloroflexi bacterium]|nr:helix-turn-helix transcriptional regulator [Chloroflexota bacterium]